MLYKNNHKESTITTVPTYDAVAVFGTKLQPDGKFPAFVYDEIDHAIGFLKRGRATYIIFCGSHSLKAELKGEKECEVAKRYVDEHYPEHSHRVLMEDQSTCIPENWLFLRKNFPTLRRIHLVTIAPLVPRIEFLGDWIYGDHGQLSFTGLPLEPGNFPNEARLLRDVKCILMKRNKIKRGDYKSLLNSDGSSCWNKLRLDHHHCHDHPRSS